VLTVRIQLKDKQTTRVLGEINITVENTRVTSNVERMVEKTGKEVVSFVDRSTSHYTTRKEVARYVQ
jgi:ribosomal protein L12E/L44/L45/RPP1/RPP2